MSGAPGSERPPDLTEAVLGFRVWSLGPDGGLTAMVSGSVWEAGVNEAICSPAAAPSRRPRHPSPHPGCRCGFNAYFGLDPQLRVASFAALGAIAAWGEMDVYADGFRAQFAQVIALSIPADDAGIGVGPAAIDRLRRAARRYDVPLVPVADLRAEALRHASPPAPSILPKRTPKARRPRAAPAPKPKRAGAGKSRPSAPAHPRPVVSVASWKQARGHSIWVRRHVAVSSGEGELRLGPAPGATALVDPGAEVGVLPVGSRVEAGEVVASAGAAYPDRAIHLRAPVGGRIAAHNGRFGAELRAGDRAVSSAPWLVALAPDDTPLEDAPLLWGRPGVELYRRSVARQSDADVLAEVGPPDGFDPAALESLGASAAPPLAAHQRTTVTLIPERGRRAAIMVEHLRPLLQACGEDGTLLAA